MKYTVSEFNIEMNFDTRKVLSGLAALEKRVEQSAVRIESRLNNAFRRVNGAQRMGDMLNRINKSASRSADHISREMRRAFGSGSPNANAFSVYERNGIRAANAVRDAMLNAARAGAPAGNPRPYTPRVNNRLSGAESIRDLSHRQTTSSFYGNMQLRNPQLAQQYQQRLNELRNSSLMGNRDVSAFRNNLRSMNFEFAQIMRQASIARSQQRLNAMEGSGALSRLSGAATTLAVGFLSLQKAVEFFGEALQEGAKRQQASTMLRTAYGAQAKAITDAVDEYANKYGADRLEARQQAAQLRMTMHQDIFSDKDIPKLLETESVFAHQTGMTQDAVGRLNYAMQQIATSTHLMGQDWLQVVNASPALIQQLLQLTGKKSVKDLKELAQAMSGADFVKKMTQAMEQLNTKTNAAVAAQNSMMAVQGRMSNAVKDSQDKFFQGFEGGFKNLLAALTNLLGDNQDVFLALGKSLGSFFNTLAGYVYALDNFTMISKAYLADLSDWWKDFFKGLPAPVQVALTKVGDIFKTWTEGMLVTAALFGGGAVAKKGGSWLMRLLGLGGAGAAVAEGGSLAVAGAPALPIAAATLLTYLGLKTAGYDPAYVQKNEQGIPGVPAENSRAGQFLNWLSSKADNLAGGYNTSLNTPVLYTMGVLPPPVNSNVRVQLDEIKFSPLTLNIPLPDGQNYVTTVDVNNLIQSQTEVQMMSSQGLGGGWQVAGQNAGFSPSLLNRKG